VLELDMLFPMPDREPEFLRARFAAEVCHGMNSKKGSVESTHKFEVKVSSD
jgi:hypothetical protein